MIVKENSERLDKIEFRVLSMWFQSLIFMYKEIYEDPTALLDDCHLKVCVVQWLLSILVNLPLYRVFDCARKRVVVTSVWVSACAGGTVI